MNNATSSFYYFCTIIVAVLWLTACTNDMLDPPESPEFCDDLITSYNTNVKPIIDESCAYSGCHDGSGGVGPGNYRSYEGLQGILEAGTFRDRVLNQKDDPTLGMPPDQSVYPESKKDELTVGELEIIECWLNSGFPKD